MTPLQIAKEQCSNYSDNKCQGWDFDTKGHHKRFREPGECWLAKPGVRCPFFEECVMPMDRSALSPLMRQEWEDTIRTYRRSANVVSLKDKRICPQCKTRELEKGRRLCYICKAANRRDTWRDQKEGL